MSIDLNPVAAVLFTQEEITDIQATAAEWGTDVPTLVHDTVMNEIAHSGSWGNSLPTYHSPFMGG